MAMELKNWNPDENWGSEERKISWRNLAVSIPALTVAFSVWSCWGVICVLMQNIGFNFSNNDFFSLVSIAGLAGATLRIPSTFMLRMAGGRDTNFITTAMLLIPVIGTAIGLQNFNTPLWYFKVMALLSGIGGGNFASSMANIGPFFPNKNQGMALGLNAGIGNLGVTLAQLIIPIVVGVGLFHGSPQVLKTASGSVLGVIEKGTHIWLQNSGYIWVVFLIPIIICIYFFMNNLKPSKLTHASIIILPMMMIGFATTILGVFLINLGLSNWITMPLVIVVTVFVLKYVPGEIGKNVSNQYMIFKSSDTWVMTILYTMTFGSFIGFAAVFPLSISIIFSQSHVLTDAGTYAHLANPNAPNVLSYAWLGAFVGAIMRPIGGILSDKVGGSRITLICSVVLCISAVVLARYMRLAYTSATPEIYFLPFLLTFILLFAMTGIGNGSTFRSIAVIFGKSETGAVTGWASAVAAYGSFFIPELISKEIRVGTPEKALYALALFYAVCALACWVVYMRPGCKIKNP